MPREEPECREHHDLHDDDRDVGAGHRASIAGHQGGRTTTGRRVPAAGRPEPGMIPHSAISAALSELPESVLQIGVIRPVVRVVGKSETSTVEILQGREQLAIRVLAQPARYVNPMIGSTPIRCDFPVTRVNPLQTVPSAGLIERPQEKNRVDALRQPMPARRSHGPAAPRKPETDEAKRCRFFTCGPGGAPAAQLPQGRDHLGALDSPRVRLSQRVPQLDASESCLA